jgi:hypothetical protein
MGRQKKIKTVQENIEPEVKMDNEQELDSVQTELDLARQELEKVKLDIEEKKAQIKANANREVGDQEIKIIEKQITNQSNQTTLKEKIAKQKEYDSKVIRGRFMNRRAPGQPVKLAYIKYDTDPVKWYPFNDGGTYEIPRGFADQINGGTELDPCYYRPNFIQKPGEMDPDDPSTIHSVDTSNKKYAFVPIDF